MSDRDDNIRLKHMLDAAKEVVSFTKGRKRDDLEDDQMLLRALSMSIGIIGEAASRVDEDVQNNNSDIPWKKIVAMRNFLFHEYFRVDPEILWNTATKSVPPLIPQLALILSDEKEE